MERIWERIKDSFELLLEKWQEIALLATIIGYIVLPKDIQAINDNAEKKELIIKCWEEQLPEEHWIKEEPFGGVVSLYQSMLGVGTTTLEWGSLMMGQADDIGTIIEMTMETEKNIYRGKYKLCYADNGRKVWKTIKLKQGQSMKVEFFREDVLQEFDISEDECAEKYNLLVLSCVEDTSIATIYDGEITAYKKGKTLLQLFCDGEVWEYVVKVK